MRARGTLIVSSVIFAVALVAAADLVGLATIVGAFAGGLVLATTERREHIEDQIKPVADLLVPVFFVTVGMKVQPAMLDPFATNAQFGVAMLLTAVAVVSKLAAGFGRLPGWRASVACRGRDGAARRGRADLRRDRSGGWSDCRGPVLGARCRGDVDDIRDTSLVEGPLLGGCERGDAQRSPTLRMTEWLSGGRSPGLGPDVQ